MPTNTPNTVTYIAIGDIHGRLDLLKRLHEKLIDYCNKNQKHTFELVYLGDYIDRGPQSKQVIDFLLSESTHLYDSLYRFKDLASSRQPAFRIQPKNP